MSQVYKIASMNSSHRKHNDIGKHDSKWPLTAVLGKDDQVLIRNLSERGGGGKMRSFLEDKVHWVIENLNSENITYKVQPENDLNGKMCTLHRSMPLSCDNLLDDYNWSKIVEDDISKPRGYQIKTSWYTNRNKRQGKECDTEQKYRK